MQRMRYHLKKEEILDGGLGTDDSWHCTKMTLMQIYSMTSWTGSKGYFFFGIKEQDATADGEGIPTKGGQCTCESALPFEVIEGGEVPQAYRYCPYVEYKGKIPSDELESKRVALEKEANHLVVVGGKVFAAILPYKEAAALCGGELPDYIPKVQ
eukprot:Gb_24711 [translate_table: standard]